MKIEVFIKHQIGADILYVADVQEGTVDLPENSVSMLMFGENTMMVDGPYEQVSLQLSPEIQ